MHVYVIARSMRLVPLNNTRLREVPIRSATIISHALITARWDQRDWSCRSFRSNQPGNAELKVGFFENAQILNQSPLYRYHTFTSTKPRTFFTPVVGTCVPRRTRNTSEEAPRRWHRLSRLPTPWRNKYEPEGTSDADSRGNYSRGNYYREKRYSSCVNLWIPISTIVEEQLQIVQLLQNGAQERVRRSRYRERRQDRFLLSAKLKERKI